MLAELVPVERVVGISVFADDASTSNCAGFYPPRVVRLRAEPERVLALDPDLVCVAGYTDIEALRLLAGAGLPLLRWARLDSFAEVVSGLRLLGAAVGAEGRAEALAAGVEATLAGLEQRLRGVPPVRVLYYDTPGYTMGAGTLVDEMIARAGGRNAAAELGMRGPGQLGIEMVLALEPEIIVMPRYGGASEAAVAGEQLGARHFRSLLGPIAARVREVPAAHLTTVSHHAARGLAHVARLLHPQALR
jgi:iron complex transport system substrate-binding protein